MDSNTESTTATPGLESTNENWPVIHKLYSEQVGLLSRGHPSSERGQAYIAASEVVGPQLNPPMTGEEFRKRDMRYMLSLQMLSSKPRVRKPRANHATETPAEPGQGQLALKLGITAEPNTKEMSMTARAENIFRGIHKDETRWEVVQSAIEARRFQLALGNYAKKKNWKKGAYASSIIAETVFEDGEPRVLVAVKRFQ